MVLDSLVSVVALVLTPVLVPLPGPNLFLYYPGLRTISHYLARKGTLHGLRLQEKKWSTLPEIAEIEAILSQEAGSTNESGTIEEIARRLNLQRLPHFLQRYS
jgi:hypothetical protein